jgi:hypothetical protein
MILGAGTISGLGRTWGGGGPPRSAQVRKVGGRDKTTSLGSKSLPASRNLPTTDGLCHRVGSLLSFFASRRNWDSPTPSAAGEFCPFHWSGGGGGAHSLAGEGLGESQFRRGDIHCGVLYILWLISSWPTYCKLINWPYLPI